MDTLFAPLIHPSRMAAYQPTDFTFSAAADDALEITFTPLEREDLDVHLPAQCLIFLLPAGVTTAILGGPTVTPALDALAIQILSLSNIATEARAKSNPPSPFAPWWIVEGIERGDLMRFIRADPEQERRQATAKGYGGVGNYRDAIETGTTSFNVSYNDEVGKPLSEPLVVTTLTGRPGDPVTFRISTWYAWDGPPTQYSTMPASSCLATLGVLKPSLAAHPLVMRAGSDLMAGDLGIHVAFQYWVPAQPIPPARIASETDKGTFERMPAGTVVRLMKVSTLDPNTRTEVASGVLDADGKIAFSAGATQPQAVARAGLATAANEVLAFQVETSNRFVTQYQRDGSPRSDPAELSYGANPTPGVWLTYGLASTTGEPGSLTGLDTYPGASLGLPSAPIVYNVGIPVFLQIEYVRLLVVASAYTTSYERAPKGVLVSVTNDAETDLGVFRTDENGQVYGLVTAWNPAAVDLRIRVHYQIEDRPPAGSYYDLGLPRIDGVVQNADPPTVPVETHFDSSWENPQASSRGRQNFGFSGPFSGANLGFPAATPPGLEVVKVGAIGTGRLGVGDSQYESSVEGLTGRRSGKRLYGEHGGLLDALKTLRHAHEWWHNLTATVGSATPQPHLQQGWRDLFDAWHRDPVDNAGLTVRVVPSTNVMARGGASQVPGTDRFHLYLLHPGAWNTLRPMAAGEAPLKPQALALLWNRGTVHHEFAHIVLMVAAELVGANSAGLAAGVGVYNNAYRPLQIERETFTPLLEGVSNTLSLMVQSSNGTMLGEQFGMHSSGTIVVLSFKDDPQLDPLITSGKTKANGTVDPRLGLFVPGALANAQWRLLAGAAPSLGPIPDITAPDPKKPDLRDILGDITNTAARTLFQRVVWLPMRALSVPDSVSGSTRRWLDLEGNKAYPTTFSLMNHLANHPDCYPALSGAPGAEKDQVRALFGTATGLSWHLWNQWPP